METSVDDIAESEGDLSPQGQGKGIVTSSSDESIEVIRAAGIETPIEEKLETTTEQQATEGATFTTPSQHGDEKDSAARPQTLPETPTLPRRTSAEDSEGGGIDGPQRSLSDLCFLALFWAAAVVMLWRHFLIIMPLLPLLIALIFLKRLAGKLGSWEWLKNQFIKLKGKICEDPRFDILAPKPVQGLGKLLLRGDRKVVRGLEKSMDNVVSILIILLLFVGVFLFSFFMAVQVHRESMLMVTLSGNIFNNSVNPELSQWMPNGEEMQKTMDSMLGNAYVYGREWIATKFKSLFSGDGGSTEQQEELEQQVLELWDKIYELWFGRNTTNNGDANSKGLEATDWSSVLDMVKNTDFSLNIFNIINDNIDVVRSVMESIWTVLKSNITLATNILTALLSAILGGGTAILNFVLSAIVFLTTLFYLLASSGSQYKPMEWLMQMSPSQGAGGSRLGKAMEEAIASVFMASLKMAAFYGMYTWLSHTVFSINIVFIPSALAAMFAAIPFLGTYWAALPAVIQLWLVNGQPVHAALFLVIHLLPSYVVDTAIYSEIKGGHPYLTGLAIAGGMYWMGLEGAIIGPILLCSVIVAFSMYGSMMKPDTAFQQPATALKVDSKSQ